MQELHAAVRDARAIATSSTSTSSRPRSPSSATSCWTFLVKNGIDAKSHYPIAIHQQAGYPWGKGARIVGPIPNAERNAAAASRCRCSRNSPSEEVDYVIDKVLEWDRQAG